MRCRRRRSRHARTRSPLRRNLPCPPLTNPQLPYTGLVDADAKNIMYGFALFFGGLVRLRCPALHCPTQPHRCCRRRWARGSGSVHVQLQRCWFNALCLLAMPARRASWCAAAWSTSAATRLPA